MPTTPSPAETPSPRETSSPRLSANEVHQVEDDLAKEAYDSTGAPWRLFLFVTFGIPLLVFAVSATFGGILAAIEGWTFSEGLV